MLDKAFTSIIENNITAQTYIICTLTSLVLGSFAAWAYTYKTKYTKSFVITLAILPAIVQVVIMLVNGNLGAGVAVAGAFSLVRFRSAPGTAKEIGSIFLAMAIGLATGMGYIGIACVFSVVICAFTLLVTKIGIGDVKSCERELKITVPESLDYTEMFDDIFLRYTDKSELNKVKTTNMGSLYQLNYSIELKDEKNEKKFIDELRCRNGNLEIVSGRVCARPEEL